MIVLGFDMYAKNKYRSNSLSEIENTNEMNKISYMYQVIENMSINEENGILPDSELKKELEVYAKKMTKTYDSSLSLALNFQFIYICEYFELEYADKLKTEIMDFYNAESNLFSNAKTNLSVNTNCDLDVTTTVTFANDIYRYVDKERYDIVGSCVSLYNEYIYKLQKSKEGTDEYYDIEDIVHGIFRFLYSINEHDRIDCELLIESMNKYIEECKSDISVENPNINTVSSATTLYETCNALGIEGVEYGLDQSVYETLKTEESFGVETSILDNFISICFAVKGIDDVSKNEVYVNNIHKWQRQYCEEVIF